MCRPGSIMSCSAGATLVTASQESPYRFLVSGRTRGDSLAPYPFAVCRTHRVLCERRGRLCELYTLLKRQAMCPGDFGAKEEQELLPTNLVAGRECGGSSRGRPVMTRDTPSGSAKSRKRDGRGPLGQGRKKGHQQSGSRGAPGGPKGSTPDKHGGSGVGRQEGGSGAGRER